VTTPRVIVHTAVSLDGATTGFDVDVGAYYSLLPTWDEDVTLTGADTILAQEAALADAPRPGPTEGAPILAVVDSRDRVREWEALRDCGHWSDAIALRGDGGQVELAGAVRSLADEHGAETIRVDSGGGLSGAMIERDLVDEISLLVHPCLAGGKQRWFGSASSPRDFEQIATGSRDDDLVWLRYRRV
jgi:2,5-diamino-6-(ribosylamino)-4(3H)-pyrimidinone 5'-phosphate reductase